MAPWTATAALRLCGISWHLGQPQTEDVILVSVQDNSPPHNKHETLTFLEHPDVEVIDWHAWSPGMNPLGYMWDQLSVWIRDMDQPPSSAAELQQDVGQARNAMDRRMFQVLVYSQSSLPEGVILVGIGDTEEYFTISPTQNVQLFFYYLILHCSYQIVMITLFFNIRGAGSRCRGA